MKIVYKMRKSILLLIFNTLLLKPIYSQEIVFTASAPDSVGVDEIFEVEYTINKNTDSFSITKSIENFEYISGPNTSLSTNISIIKGKTTQIIQKTFVYRLKPITKGSFIISKAYIIVDGKKYYSNPVTIEVTDIPKKYSSDSFEEITREDLYLNLSLSKQEVYVQEAITATLTLFSKLPVSEITDIELPAFNEFLFYDLTDSVHLKKIDTVDGKKITSVIIKQILLYPQKSGRLLISGGKIKCNVQKNLKKGIRKSFFDDSFFDLFYKYIEHSLEIDSQVLTVKPMPENKPTDFIHICGTNITLTATVNKTSVKANMPFVYEIKLSGNGNLKMASIPMIKLPVEFKEVANCADNHLETTKDGIIGYRTFSYTIIPKQEGYFKIPEYSFSYFDLDTKQYRTVFTQPIWIKVVKCKKAQLTFKDVSLLSKEVIESKEDSELMIVMDVSSSMLAQDMIPNRLKASVDATKKFLLNQKGKVGLVIFSEGSRVKCPLTYNLKEVNDSLSTISDSDLGEATAIGIGLCNAILELNKSNTKFKAIILFTDGVNNMGSITPKMAASLAASFGIRIYSICVTGKDSIALYPIKTPLGLEMKKMPIQIDEKILSEIANTTNGMYFRATDNNSFDDIYQKIANYITLGRRNDQYYSDMPKEDAERILNVISQDIEEVKGKLMKK